MMRGAGLEPMTFRTTGLTILFRYDHHIIKFTYFYKKTKTTYFPLKNNSVEMILLCTSALFVEAEDEELKVMA